MTNNPKRKSDYYLKEIVITDDFDHDIKSHIHLLKNEKTEQSIDYFIIDSEYWELFDNHPTNKPRLVHLFSKLDSYMYDNTNEEVLKVWKELKLFVESVIKQKTDNPAKE